LHSIAQGWPGLTKQAGRSLRHIRIVPVGNEKEALVPRAAGTGKRRGSSVMMTLEEVAKYLRLHRSTVYRLAREGIIPGFKVGSQWRFHKGRVDQWMAGQEADFAGSQRKDG